MSAGWTKGRWSTQYHCETEDCGGSEFALERTAGGSLLLVCTECEVGRLVGQVLNEEPSPALVPGTGAGGGEEDSLVGFGREVDRMLRAEKARKPAAPQAPGSEPAREPDGKETSR